jgi:hypothetical protein
MATNLLRPNWGRLDSHELRILLAHRVGQPGQYDGRENSPNRLYLPSAGAECRVVLTFCGEEIVNVEPGQGFDPSLWDAIASEIETSVLTGPMMVGREYSFSSHRVQGSWRGPRSGVQLLPCDSESPLAPVEMAEHPFILEFPIQKAEYWPITNHRRIREHRDLTLLLNVLLRSRVNSQPRRPQHFWGTFCREGGGHEPRWVQNSYFGKLGMCVLDAHSPSPDQPLEVIESDQYYSQLMGIDGKGLRVPDDLDDSICRYRTLHPERRAEFDRMAFWLDIASRQWSLSMSASFAALVSAVESLINRDGPGSTQRFRGFFETYAPGATVINRRNQMYRLRSNILHGSELMTMDQDVAFGWDLPWWNARELHEELWTVTRTVARNWLRNPPPV